MFFSESAINFGMTHLRFANLPFDEQRCALIEIIKSYPEVMSVFERARDLQLPEHWIVSGAIYNNVWNYLTERPVMTGVKDIDIFYFENNDLSYEAEDLIIKQADGIFAQQNPPVEVRNQARVHLWYEKHFGHEYKALKSAAEGIDRFASITHSVGMRLLDNDQFEVYAPYGLNEIFCFRLSPNYLLPNKKTHLEKGARQLKHWPELELIPWDETLEREVERHAG